MKTALCVLVLMCSAPVFAADKPANITDGEWALANAVVNYETTSKNELNMAKAKLETIIKSKPSKTKAQLVKDAQERVAAIEDRIAKLQKGEIIVPEISPATFEFGQAGHLKTKVEIILTERNGNGIYANVPGLKLNIGSAYIESVDSSKMISGETYAIDGNFYVTKRPDGELKLVPVSANKIGDAVKLLRAK